MAILHNMYRMRNIYFLKCIFVPLFQVRTWATARQGYGVLTAPHHPALFAKGSHRGQA
jgi:hypothetical protein